ncbi:hypothetical protein [Rhizobium sp. P44RR-XXIV]|uniref:hypothetical protein n=1 Tax=Rhizobium sp. P44RR-XXIV TaxID=1921145 RepID=UPI000984C4FB|nr:hypothetical protein [Rhizobium sp. P44RR-XXIV]
MMTLTRVGFAFALAVLSASPALADACADHYESSGVPLVTAITYKTWMVFPSVNPNAAFDKVSRAVLAEGFVDVNAEKKLGTLTAQQETSGSGRPQTLRVVVRKNGKGSRIDALFMVQAGQVAPGVSKNLCRIANAAGE